MRPASLPSGRWACFIKTTGRPARWKASIEAVDVGHDVGGMRDEGRTVLVEVLALHVDDQQRRMAVSQVVDHERTSEDVVTAPPGC